MTAQDSAGIVGGCRIDHTGAQRHVQRAERVRKAGNSPEIHGDGRRGAGKGHRTAAAQRGAAETLGVDDVGVHLTGDVERRRAQGERRHRENVRADVGRAGGEVQQERALADRRRAGVGVLSVEHDRSCAGFDEGDGSATGILD